MPVMHDESGSTTRVCKVCGKELPITEFQRIHKNNKDYYLHICRNCANLQKRTTTPEEPRKKKPAETLSQAIAAARALGLSYGEYTAKKNRKEIKKK